jgi:hypothetical protein
LHGFVLSKFSRPYKAELDPDNQGLDKMFKFVFVRHPFERLVSAYFDKFVQDPDLRDRSCQTFHSS